MTNAEFNAQVRPLNIQYKELFQEIPCIADYACSREEFLQAMQKAVETKQEISVYVSPVIKKIE